MTTVNDFQQKLLAQRRALLRQVSHVESDLRWLDSSTHSETEEEAQEQNLARLLARLDDRGNDELRAIDHALGRIVDGSYGECEDCEEPIPVARLEVLPAAALCVFCAEARERAAARQGQPTSTPTPTPAEEAS
jgi:DnaK suppressor protein